MAHVPGVHDDELRDEVVLLRPLVVARLRRDRARVDPVRDHAKPSGRRPLRLQAQPHRLPDRDDAVRAAEVRGDERPQHADHCRIPETVELGRDLREDVLADDEHGGAEPPPHRDAEISDDRRVGHAEDEIGSGPAKRVGAGGAEVGEVVRRAAGELRALVRGRRDADDADAVVLGRPRRVLVPVQDAGDDLDLVVLGEPFAELRQEVRGRLDPGPVVLVQDEDAGAASVRRPSGKASGGAHPLRSASAAASRTAARKPSTLGP